MKLTEAKLKNLILEILTEGLPPPTKGGAAERDAAVEEIVRMLKTLDDPETEFRQIEFEARAVCKKLGVRFSEAMILALMAIGIEPSFPFELR